MDWPDWWSWDLELTPHLFKRMLDRRFNEVDLRLMLDAATGFRENHEEGRFVVETTHDGRPWEVIVEPSSSERVLIVVTAYPLD
ncbi:MAG: DUF4258 domain-containing protein [Planctomycetaceae bacterium]|nr:DUF4258 domain-containing protein [Planctomycetaceae bacterium]